MWLYPVPSLSAEQVSETLPSVTELVERQSVTSIDTDDSGIQDRSEIQAEEEEDNTTTKVQELAQTTVSSKSSEKSQRMMPLELLAIFLILCLILFALSIMWDNLFTTLFICCITLPILKWMGKV